MAIYDSMKQQRWGRDDALAAAKRYNTLAREHGLSATQLALAFCYTKWQVASTIIGVTSVEQLEDDCVRVSSIWGDMCFVSSWHLVHEKRLYFWRRHQDACILASLAD